jgi:CBS domain-containing protein
MKVRDIMTSGSLATATLDATLEEIANMMKAENVGAIPVLDDEEKLAGLITDRDIVVRAIAEGEDPTECTAEDILSGQMHTIGPDADVLEAIDLMSRHQVRRLPVVEEEQVVGILSLGDVSVKSGQEEAGEALEEISSGVRRTQSGEAGQSGPENRQQQSGRESDQGNRGRSTSGRSNQPSGGGDQRRQSPGEQVAEEESEYQSTHQDTSVRGTPQMGGTRSESGLSGRVRNAPQSRQSFTDDLVNTESEEEPEFQNAGGGQARQRANKQEINARAGKARSGQQSSFRGQQKSSTRGQQQSSTRGRQDSSVRGRDSGKVRGEDAGRSRGGNAQGISNRSARQENQRQQKAAPVRAEGKNPRSSNKRKAS